jgi:hypothetical protein
MGDWSLTKRRINHNMKLISYFSCMRRFVFPTLLFCAATANASPTLGAHALAFYPFPTSSNELSIPAITTQATGSTVLAWVGRGSLSAFTPATIPTDNKSNNFALIGSVHDYSPNFPQSGSALYVSPSVLGGSGYVVTAPMPAADEITLAVVEVTNGGLIQDAQFNKVLTPPQTSLNVTTTGPATLVSFWTGDSGAPFVTAQPNNGFVTIDSELQADYEVEAVVATKDVAVAGTYNVTWTATPTQIAYIWLVAVQSAPPVLHSKISGSNLVISWPTSAVGYNLEMTSNITQTSAWTTVTNVPVTVNLQNVISNTISSTAKFYRLKK